jgi:hypothetical protein
MFKRAIWKRSTWVSVTESPPRSICPVIRFFTVLTVFIGRGGRTRDTQGKIQKMLVFVGGANRLSDYSTPFVYFLFSGREIFYFCHKSFQEAALSIHFVYLIVWYTRTGSFIFRFFIEEKEKTLPLLWSYYTLLPSGKNMMSGREKHSRRRQMTIIRDAKFKYKLLHIISIYEIVVSVDVMNSINTFSRSTYI